MALTDTAIKQAKPASKPYTLTDGDGLSLQVPTTGSKRWHFRFYWHDKQLRISLGTYPDVSLKEARQRREAARALVANNIDPRSHRRAERQKASHAANNTFEAVAGRWHEFRSKKLTKSKKGSAGQASKYLKKDMLPCLGNLPISDISRGDVLELIRRIERRGALVSARKVTDVDDIKKGVSFELERISKNLHELGEAQGSLAAAIERNTSTVETTKTSIAALEKLISTEIQSSVQLVSDLKELASCLNQDHSAYPSAQVIYPALQAKTWCVVV